MVNKEIVDYIKKNLKSGFLLDDIKKELINIGWPNPDVEEAADAAQENEKPAKEEKKKGPNIVDMDYLEKDPEEEPTFVKAQKLQNEFSEKNERKGESSKKLIVIPVIGMALIIVGILIFFLL